MQLDSATTANIGTVASLNPSAASSMLASGCWHLEQRLAAL